MMLTPGGRQAVCVARRAARPRLIELLGLVVRGFVDFDDVCRTLAVSLCVSVCLSCRCVSRGPEGSKE